jgi:hypothetical protein
MLWAVLRPPANLRLDNMSPVQEWHLPVGLYPDLIACVFREDGNFPVFVNLPADWLGFVLAQPQINIPKHVPNDSNLSLDIEVAMLAMESRT